MTGENTINWDEVVNFVQTTGGETSKQVWAKLTPEERPLYLEALKRWQSESVPEARPDANIVGMEGVGGLPPEAVLGMPSLIGMLKSGAKKGPIGTPPNLSQKTSTEAVKAGQGPSGGARGARLKSPSSNPSNVQRVKSVKDEEKLLGPDAPDEAIRQVYHQAGGAQKKGVALEGFKGQVKKRSPK